MVNIIPNCEGQLALGPSFIKHYLLDLFSNKATDLPRKKFRKSHIFILQKNPYKGSSLKMSVKFYWRQWFGLLEWGLLFRWEDRSQFRDCSSLEVNSPGKQKGPGRCKSEVTKTREKLNGEIDMLRVTKSFWKEVSYCGKLDQTVSSKSTLFSSRGFLILS